MNRLVLKLLLSIVALALLFGVYFYKILYISTGISASMSYTSVLFTEKEPIFSHSSDILPTTLQEIMAQLTSSELVSAVHPSTHRFLRYSKDPLTEPLDNAKSLIRLTQISTSRYHMSDTKNVFRSMKDTSTGQGSVLPNYSKTCNHVLKRKDSISYSGEENVLIFKCFSDYKRDYNKGLTIWFGNKSDIRWNHHVYLNKNSVVMDIGGNTGIDAQHIISMFHPMFYLVLEPVKLYYDHLVKMFSNENSVLVFQFGAGSRNTQLNVSIAGKDGDATSVFEHTTNKTTKIQLYNITDIFIGLGLNCLNELDLLTINCEGCEFEILEEILKTNMIMFIKNIQFATHTTLLYLKNPIERYCKIQELLSRTHIISYQYKFIWESWKRKNEIRTTD